MRKAKQDQSIILSKWQEIPVASDTLLRALRDDGYEPGYGRGAEAGTQFAASLRFRRTAGQIIVPNELARIIERTMIRWEAAGGHEMTIKPLTERTTGFETVRGEMCGFSAGLMDAL
ncbi:hypothetical protein [Lamprocystis purpurea]|jgi:hypothetical protein|uniref:hypothetical protein n=1 Tax=Lamprocystis purpurea TaxID=61598 RepID=UPI0003748768|nr:hypothetical protein [Lamprocystis purpurea]